MAVLATFQAGCDGRPAETLSAGGDPSQGAVAPAPSPNSRESTSIRSLVASEELILQLGTQIDLLNQSALNLCIPDSGSRPLFARRIRVVDLAAAAEGDSSQALPLDA